MAPPSTGPGGPMWLGTSPGLLLEVPKPLPRGLACDPESVADHTPGDTASAHEGDQVLLETLELRALTGHPAEHPHHVLL